MLRYALLAANALCLFLSLVCFYVDDALKGLGFLSVPFISAWFWHARAEQDLSEEELESWIADERNAEGWSLEQRDFDRWNLFERLWAGKREETAVKDSSKAYTPASSVLSSVFTSQSSREKKVRKRAKIRLGVLEREISEESL